MAVFINGKNKIDKIKNTLNNDKVDIFKNNWDEFINRDNSIMLFNKKFNKNIEEKTHLVFYSIPFSLYEFKNILNNFKYNKDIHFIFNNSDLVINNKLIKSKLPNEKLLKEVFNYILDQIQKNKINITNLYDNLNNKYNISKSMFENIIKIYIELKIIEKNDKDIFLKTSKKAYELDLSNSVYYNNIIKIKEDQKKLNKLLSDKNLFNFIKNLTNLKEENNEF